MPATGRPLQLHPDRLLPAEPGARAVARRLYEAVRDLPIISPHRHVDPRLLLDNAPFPDPATLFVTPDHYVTRLLHASGIGARRARCGPRATIGGRGPDSVAVALRALECVPGYAELAEIFDVALHPSAQTADAIYDQLAERLATDAYRPRALYERFKITVLATTDDPVDDLSAHAALAVDPAWPGRVIPRSARTATWSRRTRVARRGCATGQGCRRGHRRVRRLHTGARRAAAVLHRARGRLG